MHEKWQDIEVHGCSVHVQRPLGDRRKIALRQNTGFLLTEAEDLRLGS